MLAVCMTLIDNDKDQTSFEDFYFRNRQIAYAFAYKILNNSALAEELLKINAGTLGTSGKEEYDSLTEKIYPKVCESLYATSQKNYQVANYDTAVTNLEQVVQMDEGYQDG